MFLIPEGNHGNSAFPSVMEDCPSKIAAPVISVYANASRNAKWVKIMLHYKSITNSYLMNISLLFVIN